MATENKYLKKDIELLRKFEFFVNDNQINELQNGSKMRVIRIVKRYEGKNSYLPHTQTLSVDICYESTIYNYTTHFAKNPNDRYGPLLLDLSNKISREKVYEPFSSYIISEIRGEKLNDLGI